VGADPPAWERKEVDGGKSIGMAIKLSRHTERFGSVVANGRKAEQPRQVLRHSGELMEVGILSGAVVQCPQEERAEI